MKTHKGFTLLELVTVMAILSILSGILFGNFVTSLSKSRDSRRKQDLDNIQKALEVYYNGNEQYPVASGASGLPWGSPLQDTHGVPKVYMQRLPYDTSSNMNYVYQSDGTYYKLYSCLENDKDASYDAIHPVTPPNCGTACNGTCHYGISSGNAYP